MELYPENLRTLQNILGYVEDVGNQDGVFEVEIRVRLDDVDEWAVLGYGESGDPCVLRFEGKEKPSFIPHPNTPGVRGPGTSPGTGTTGITWNQRLGGNSEDVA